MFESRRRALIFILLSFIMAVIGGLLFYSKLEELNQDLGEVTEIYVADGSIPSREIITESMVTTIEIPNRYLTDGHIISIDQLDGMVSVVPLQEGDQLTLNLLRPITDLTEDGNRLVEMKEEWGNIHFDSRLENLDLVDIVISHSFEDEPVTEVFMRDVPVVRIIDNEGGYGVGLEVSTQDASNLIHMQHYADRIRILKSSTGRSNVATRGDDELEEEDEQLDPDVSEEVIEETDEKSD